MSEVEVLRKATPVLVVERIEPVLRFWNKLGVEAVTQVPDGAAGDGRLAFAILAAPGIEIMYQTADSVREDLLKSASDKDAWRAGAQQVTLFVEVGNLDEVERRLQGERLVMPRRTTFYGSVELGYAEPAGNIVVFAQHMAEAGETA